MIRKLAFVLLFCAVAPAWAQSVPAANYTDMWWNSDQSGWGISFVQHGSNQVYAVWYTYDPREPDAASGQFKPMWIVMAGQNTWTTPTSVTGPVYVTNGRPFSQPGSNTTVTPVGTFTFNFSSNTAGTFTYNIAPPAGLAATDPAFNLPTLSGSKAIVRQGF
jgi:hypothetical protein